MIQSQKSTVPKEYTTTLVEKEIEKKALGGRFWAWLSLSTVDQEYSSPAETVSPTPPH